MVSRHCFSYRTGSRFTTDWTHNQCLLVAAGHHNSEEMIRKALDWGLMLEESPINGQIIVVNRMGPKYICDWYDNAFGSNRFTAAHMAAFNGCIGSVKLLLQKGWTWWATDADGNSVLDILRAEGNNSAANSIEETFQKPHGNNNHEHGCKHAHGVVHRKVYDLNILRKEVVDDADDAKEVGPLSQVSALTLDQIIAKKHRSQMKARIMNCKLSEVISP